MFLNKFASEDKDKNMPEGPDYGDNQIEQNTHAPSQGEKEEGEKDLDYLKILKGNRKVGKPLKS